jgi:hypothetical protein
MKAHLPMPLHIPKEMTHYSEMNNELFNIDMNMWHIARNIIKPISFHLFHGHGNSRV